MEANTVVLGTKLRFANEFQFFLEPSFYTGLRELKLHTLKLKTDLISIHCKSTETGNITLNSNALSDEPEGEQKWLQLKGVLKNFNTLEEFKALGKVEYLHSTAIELFEQTSDLNELCSTFFMISFAELKKYTFLYWTALPVFHCEGVTFSTRDYLELVDTIEIQKSLEKLDSKFVRVENEMIYFRDLGEHVVGVVPSFVKNVLLKLHIERRAKKFVIRMVQNQRIREYKIDIVVSSQPPSIDSLKVTGWTKNVNGKLSPKFVDLSNMLDPYKMNEQSVDLNLQLMKWRIQPDLNLDIIQSQKVLLLGSGTLGCYIARVLLAWGVKTITFVDNGTVSHSNPVRQPLFNFEDVGKPKAQAAMDNLKKIFPAVSAHAHMLEVPMIGHSITDEEKQKKDYEQLERLLMEHDVVFLVMDSRETRWLPTVMGKAQNKLVMNAALGFDSFLVMRHGNHANKLGCYFCNDITAPSDSLKDRSLDQMCTVTRPGCALMASSLAVEIMVSHLQSLNDDGTTCLGDATPHQIRGFLSNFNNIKLETPQYQHCAACSVPIVQAYRDGGWEFVKHAMNDYKIVEDLSGLTKVQMDTEERMMNVDFDDFSDSDDGLDDNV